MRLLSRFGFWGDRFYSISVGGWYLIKRSSFVFIVNYGKAIFFCFQQNWPYLKNVHSLRLKHFSNMAVLQNDKALFISDSQLHYENFFINLINKSMTSLLIGTRRNKITKELDKLNKGIYRQSPIFSLVTKNTF